MPNFLPGAGVPEKLPVAQAPAPAKAARPAPRKRHTPPWEVPKGSWRASAFWKGRKRAYKPAQVTKSGPNKGKMGTPQPHLEADFLTVWDALTGLPAPEAQVPYGGRFKADFGWETERVLIEIEGDTWGGKGHAHGLAIESDCYRACRAAACGWLLLRVTSKRLREDPEGIVEDIAAAIAVRQGQGT